MHVDVFYQKFISIVLSITCPLDCHLSLITSLRGLVFLISLINGTSLNV